MILKKKFLPLSIQLGLLLLLTYSCGKQNVSKIRSLAFDQNIAAPIGYGEFGVHDLLKTIDSTIVIDPTSGSMSLVYHKQLDTIFAKDVIHLDDYSELFDVTPSNLGSMTIGSFNGPSIHNVIDETFSYTTQNGAQLHDLRFESGQLTLNGSTTLKHDITLIITMHDLTNSSGVITRTLNLNYTGSVPQTATTSIDLTDVLADFTANGTAINTLRLTVDATVTGTGQPISGSENLQLSMALTNLKFKNITGYFGKQTLVNLADSILLKVFNNPIAGNLSFTDPRLTFTIDNSFGIPATIHLTNFESVNTVTNEVTPIILSQPNIDVNIPSAMGAPSATTKFNLYSSNATNISTLIDTKPKYFKYNVSAETNPSGNMLPLNFIESTSKMILTADFELPFEGYASGLAVKDTIDFTFNQDVKNIESAMFRLKVDNGFPLTFRGQAEFVDANYNHLFYLFNSSTELITAAPVNSMTHVVTATTSKTNDTSIDAAKIALLGNVKHIILSGTTETTTPQNTVVKLLDTYKIGFKLSAQIQMKGN